LIYKLKEKKRAHKSTLSHYSIFKELVGMSRHTYFKTPWLSRNIFGIF